MTTCDEPEGESLVEPFFEASARESRDPGDGDKLDKLSMKKKGGKKKNSMLLRNIKKVS